jgi:hypothetical protein
MKLGVLFLLLFVAFAALLVCVSAGDTLGNGQTLDGVLVSADERFHLQVQSDGNLYVFSLFHRTGLLCCRVYHHDFTIQGVVLRRKQPAASPVELRNPWAWRRPPGYAKRR